MARVKRGVTTKAKHKNGFWIRRRAIMAAARTRSASHARPSKRPASIAYRDRKVKKRTFRRRGAPLWIQRINAGVRAEGLTYSQFMHGLKLAGIELDRKVLADIAMHEGEAFTAIIAQAKAAGCPRPPERPDA
jgi:large subunit ribosomal protein L20